MSPIENKKFTTKLIESNFIALEIAAGEIIDEIDIHDIYASYKELVGENEYVVAVYGNPFSSISKKAREIAADQYASLKRKKVALISKNTAHVLLVTFFIRVNKPKTEIKIFKNESEAFDWLRS